MTVRLDPPELGALAVTFYDEGDEPIFEPTKETALIWKETKVVGLFDADIEGGGAITFRLRS